jgi:hypothetical protein
MLYSIVLILIAVSILAGVAWAVKHKSAAEKIAEDIKKVEDKVQ